MTDSEKLGIACRFEGIETVRMLLEHGAKFDELDGDHAVSLLNVSEQFLHGAYHLNRIEFGGEFTDDGGKKYTLLPTSERIEIYRLLKENAEKCGFQSGRLFYYAILANDTEMIAAMRENGEVLPEYLTDILTNGGRNVEWSEFCYTFEGMGAEDFFAVIGNISRELGGKINFSEILFCCVAPIIFTPEGLEFILEHFDQKKMNKAWLIKRFIEEDETGLLEVVTKHGWLKLPKKRDEMIKYASDKGKTESLAWLLEFKNRTADLVKERELAEKKMLRELNANPYSVTELKKSWNYVKNDDGKVTITGYKGKRTEVIVPARIGKDTVTEIGYAAFTGTFGQVWNIRRSLLELRRSITSVTLPESIEFIGDRAFGSCENLSEINIPPNVKSIGESTFWACHKLEKIIIPDSVTDIGKYAFVACTSLKTVRLPIGLTVIHEGLFSQCWELECIVIPESVAKIGNSAFTACKALKFVMLPPLLAEIEYGSFSGCMELEEIDIPKSVTAIGANAFGECSKLTAVVVKGSYAEKYCKENQIKFKYN